MNVRDRIKAISRQLMPGHVPPEVARASLMTLTGLLEPVMDTVRERERDYRIVLAEKMQEAKTKAGAEIQAMTTPQYDLYREAEDAKELVEQMIVTCRGFLRSIDEEARLAR